MANQPLPLPLRRFPQHAFHPTRLATGSIGNDEGVVEGPRDVHHHPSMPPVTPVPCGPCILTPHNIEGNGSEKQ